MVAGEGDGVGRVLPVSLFATIGRTTTGGGGGNATNGSYGGGAGQAGEQGGSGGHSGEAGGGGGWGAAGGKGYRGVTVSEQCQGGAAGKAVEDSGNTYTLTNNGTIYGATT